MKKQNILLFSIILLAATCGKDNETQVVTTETFENKFFFLWNGLPLYDTTNTDLLMDVNVGLLEDFDYLGIVPKLKMKSDNYGYVTTYEFYLAIQPFKVGIQDFYTHQNQDHITMYNDLECGSYYIIQNLPSSMEVIQIDKQKQIVKGKFSYTAHNNCSDTVRVSDGYFELNYTIR